MAVINHHFISTSGGKAKPSHLQSLNIPDSGPSGFHSKFAPKYATYPKLFQPDMTDLMTRFKYQTHLKGFPLANLRR